MWLWDLGKWAVRLFTGTLFDGGGLKGILDVIENGFDNQVEKDRIKAKVTERWIDAQANLLVGRTWWFQLFFVIPLGMYWSALLWVSAFPFWGWTVAAIPSPYYEWAAGIISALFIIDKGASVIDRFKR